MKATGEHISKTGKCATCGGEIEFVDGIKDPFWRHTDVRSLRRPHGATPREESA